MREVAVERAPATSARSVHAADPPSWLGQLVVVGVHLRVHWQLVLSPIFLWGFLLAGGQPSVAALVAFVAFHAFLYAGITAYNSYYDRDEGPVSGLYHPPPISGLVLPFSLVWQLAGLALALLVEPRLAVPYVALMALSVGYSHPRLRWKGSPLASSLVIFGGQGGLGFLAGWLTAGGTFVGALEPPALLAAIGAAGITLGLYPLGHLFQVAEDGRRGDRTLAIALGPRLTFRFAQLVLLGSGALAALAVATRWGLAEAAALGAAFLAATLILELWRARFRADAVGESYRRAMAFQTTLSIGFGTYIIAKLV